MSTAAQELASFTIYAQQRIDSGADDLSLDELFDQWRAENPSNELYAENVAAIQASIKDFKNGQRGAIAGEHSAQLRRELGTNAE
jgi:ferric-dicitrate binding protein FerR (iron transport regulator)